jgi:ATP-dependent DNA helicase RecQ
MKVRVFTLRIDPETGTFNDRALVDFQEEHDLLDVSEHVFVQDVPVLALVVRYREPPGPQGRRDGEPRKDWRAELDDPGKRRYDELRLWRGRTAKRDGLPPYLILSNREMAEIAMRCPASLSALKDVDGVGEAKAKRWGEEILGVLAACVPQDSLMEAPVTGGVEKIATSE